ncbi:MAG: ABC transporter permease [Chitinophagales bacterium]|nr:ABC transporter permease [Chitinophagales bacterium]MDW8274232.1 ABC transporter permease [Chitinophagales bacterium]
MAATSEKWDIEISSEQKWIVLNFSEIWRYRDLLYMFIKRDVVATYKQTILGPLWFFIQPILTTIIFLVVFGKVARLPTDGSPSTLFYLAGVVMWQYFSTSLTATSNTFVNNAAIFGKVYFPRIILPLSTALSNLVKFSAQFVLYIFVVLFYVFKGEITLKINAGLLFFPLLLVLMVISALGIGLIITSLSVKYRDIQFLTSFGVQLLMYATPVIYPLSVVPQKLQPYILINPMTAVIEGTRQAFSGFGNFNGAMLLPALISSVLLFVTGVIVYNRMEKSFIDKV